ncbi:FimV/HubP family polar landmark protein [Stutzerimonas balearica]|uniref:Peptigoglycan-binding protein LysM n=1 Tax=Stutzerimonas balearica DSM 6083 TaxID=1123016 RepID=A0A8D3Y2G2_9GAMM|nr:FimV/HubP family polar landmark protein [Stutzerimonas balearica]AJE15661.1 peptigoglycan-binding protein LysM [Stutzerimonas balearica DSM 6083]SDM50101.1 pilus assembly protein FimV [Stutzerimonas balearica DSM 6083]
MVRVRNLVLAIAAATALTTEMAHAVGLGEVTLQSSLNQPLVAEIELLDAKNLGPGEVIPGLASVEEFNRAGIDRQYFLTDLKFTPVMRPDGKSVIQVSSNKPVREPYLNFLVEVVWPSGRLLREYTLLLDPPLYSPETVAAVAPQLPIAAPQPARVPAPRPAASAGTTSAPAVGQSGEEYRTTADDTLWQVAERARRGGTVHQTMLAIQELNPGAFIDGNINRMKSGQVLRLPTAEQIAQRSQSDAIAEVARQNAVWRQGRAGGASARQLDATRRTGAGDAPARSESRDSLRLVAGEAGKATSGSDSGAASDAAALRDKLAVTQENLDSSRRENAELNDRLSDLQGQLDKLQKLMQLKDDQLAKLQAQLATDGQAAEASQPTVAPTSAPESSQSTPASTDKPSEAKIEQSAGQQPAPAKPAQPAKAPKPAAAVPAQAPEEPGLLDQYTDNPILLGVLGGSALLLLLVGLMALSRRNAMKEAELQESLLASQREDDLGLPGNYPAEPVDLGAPIADADAAQESVEPVSPATADPLAEADIYIAYGRFNQAAELLQAALNDEPQRTDLRLKLMEVYAELGDRDGFARQEAELRDIDAVGSSAQVEQLKFKYPAMAVGAVVAGAAASQTELDSLDLDELQLDDLPAAPGQDLDDAFDLSLDDLDAELSAQGAGAAELDTSSDLFLEESASADASSRTDEQELDAFSLELPEESAASSSLDEELGDFSFDLDDTQRPASDLGEVSEPVTLDDLTLSSESETEDFDFGLVEEEKAPEPLSDAFDLSLDELSFDGDEVAGASSAAEAGDEEMLSPVEEQKHESPAAAEEPIAAASDEEDFDFFADTDEATTKLDLARAYIDMGDAEGARDILDEVLAEGNSAQQQEAREMLAKLA